MSYPSEIISTSPEIDVERELFWQTLADEYGLEELTPTEPTPVEITAKPAIVESVDTDYSDRIPDSAEAWLDLSAKALTRVMREIGVSNVVGYDIEDFRQDLLCGLLSAIDSYDPRRSMPATYAVAALEKTAIDVLRYYTAQMRTPGSRVHIRTKDSYRELRDGLLDIGRPMADCHTVLTADPAEQAVDRVYSDEVVRLIHAADLTELETRAIALKLFYNGERKKTADFAPDRSLKDAARRAIEKMSAVKSDSGFSIFTEL